MRRNTLKPRQQATTFRHTNETNNTHKSHKSGYCSVTERSIQTGFEQRERWLESQANGNTAQEITHEREHVSLRKHTRYEVEEANTGARTAEHLNLMHEANFNPFIIGNPFLGTHNLKLVQVYGEFGGSKRANNMKKNSQGRIDNTLCEFLRGDNVP